MDILERVSRIQEVVKDKETNLRSKVILRNTQKDRVEKLEDTINTLQETVLLDDKSLSVFNNAIDSRNGSAKAHLESMLNHALDTIPLVNSYSIHLREFNTKRSGREFMVALLDNSIGKVRAVRTQSGTSIAQLVSLLMRVVPITFSGSRKLLLIDENLSGFQDEEMIKMFGSILVALAENEGFQILMVEHKSELKKVEGLTNINLVKSSYTAGLTIKAITRLEDGEVINMDEELNILAID